MASPLADRIRPKELEDMVGQAHLLGEGQPLRVIAESGSLPNMIFYGPSGTGKTTLARILAKKTNRTLRMLNGTNASTADIKDIVAELGTLAAPNGILLYLDELQYFNKKQQQSLLEYIENGNITLIASTTENPYFYVYNAVISRATVFEFKPISAKEIEKAVRRGFKELEKEQGVSFTVPDEVVAAIAESAGGDVRKSLNMTELCALATKPEADGSKILSLEHLETVIGQGGFRYDRSGDEHYDVMSAFQKSMRGSDPDAALHYLARLLAGGDLPSAIRRLMVCAAEDVGLAYPQILPIVKAACDLALMVGMPEARIPLADAVVLVATAPKSNSAYMGINAAMADIEKGKAGPIPRTLQNKHFDSAEVKNKGQFYQYPHSFPNRWVDQQYLPDNLKDTVYYTYAENKNEQTAKAYWDKIKGKK